MANCISHLSFEAFASREVVERKLRHNKETDRGRQEYKDCRAFFLRLFAMLSIVFYQDRQKTYK